MADSEPDHERRGALHRGHAGIAAGAVGGGRGRHRGPGRSVRPKDRPGEAHHVPGTFSLGNLRLSPDDLRPEDVPRLFVVIGPMQKTLLGPAIAQEPLDPLARELP